MGNPSWGANIRGRRNENGFTQRDLADRVGVEQSTLSRWETGVDPPFDAKVRLAAALDVPVGDLFPWPEDVAAS